MIGKEKNNKIVLEEELTKEQQDCINFNGGDLLVKGIAGSGKTLVLLHRAIKLKKKAQKENKNISIGFFTFANTLVQYSQELLKAVGLGEDFLYVNTFHSYTYKLLGKIGKRSKCIDTAKDIKPTDIISEAINNEIQLKGTSHRLYEKDNKFWQEEIAWIKGKRLKTKEQYINSDRQGRGTVVRMSKKDKEIAFDLFLQYEKLLASKKLIEFNDYSNIILDNMEKLKEEDKFDYVFVDEAQDLSFSELYLLKNITKVAITIAADHAQKIYKNSFSWKELGINVRGNSSKTLKENFRSTKQIMKLAYSLLEKNKLNKGKDTEYTEPNIPDIEGTVPELIKCRTSYEEENFLNYLVKQLKNNKNETIGIIFRTWKERKSIEDILRKNAIPYEYIYKGGTWSLINPGFKIVSYYSAKGLEFDEVIIPWLNDGIMPLDIPEDKEEDLKEFLEIERSLLYVGMTRAKKSLYMTCSEKYSQFIDEFDTNLFKVTYV